MTSLDSDPILKSITKNIGCIDGNTIQEIGGDLIFLAPDGLRTIAGTARIADIEIGSISRKILPLINEILDNEKKKSIKPETWLSKKNILSLNKSA